MSEREEEVFTSWKEIGSYLGKSVRTVQRWEQEFRLPVQRPHTKEKGTVRATRAELDDWAARTWSQKSSGQSLDASGLPANQLRETIEVSQHLCAVHREVMNKLKVSLETLAESCRKLRQYREKTPQREAALAASAGRNSAE